MNTAIVGLGSNIEPEQNITRARKILAERFQLVAESSFVPTKPFGYTDQADFINGAVLIRTESDLQPLRDQLKSIEEELGRKKSAIKFGPRTIDLDIVVFNNTVVDKDFYERDYLKTSVLQIVPNLRY